MKQSEVRNQVFDSLVKDLIDVYNKYPKVVSRQEVKDLATRISRLERIVKKGLEFEHPEISEELKEL